MLLPTRIQATTISVLGIRFARSTNCLWVGCKARTHVPRTEHRCSVDKAQTFRRQSTEVPRIEHTPSADRALTFRGHGTDDMRLFAQQFTGIRNGIPRNLSDFHKLLMKCTVTETQLDDIVRRVKLEHPNDGDVMVAGWSFTEDGLPCTMFQA